MNNQLKTQEKAQKILLADNALQIADIEQALARLKNCDYADLYFQYSRAESWGLEEGLVKNGSFSIDKGVGIRTVNGESSALAYSDDLSVGSINLAVDKLISARNIGQAGIIKVNSTPLTNRAMLYDNTDPSLSKKGDDKAEMLKWVDVNTRARAKEVIQVMTSMATTYEVILIANSENELIADIRPLVRFNISVIAEKNGRRESGSFGGGGRFGLEIFTQEKLSGYIDKALSQALTNLESRPSPAGAMSVVLGPGWPGILLHEAVGHGLEGDFIRKGSSVFAGKVGETVASKGVTVIDEGSIPNRRGSLNVDDEGTPTQKTVLIEDGVVQGFMQDRLNAKLLKVPRTGNGRRESYQHLPMPRMTNTYMLGGNYTHEEIIASVKNGIYCESFSGGQVDITNGKFVFSASESWLIKDGKLLYPLKGATIIGDGPQSLKQITMIGNNLKLDDGIGTCGKEGQGVPVGVGQPTLRIENMTVGGTEG